MNSVKANELKIIRVDSINTRRAVIVLMNVNNIKKNYLLT